MTATIHSSLQTEQKLTEKSQKVYKILLRLYGLPDWRNPSSPIDELVSTILSQNTNDTNRDRAFQNLRERYSTWEEVRDARQEDVTDTIRTAGLANQKGPRIQMVLRQITEERGSLDLDFLRDQPAEDVYQWLIRFKGVGPKTAAIVMQFSLGIPAFPVDTHVYRVTGRLGLRPKKMTVEQSHPHLSSLFRPEEYGPAHLNIIRHGREICHARNPQCNLCVLVEICDYDDKNLVIVDRKQ